VRRASELLEQAKDMNTTVVMSREGSVGIVELNRPEVKNALNLDMRKDLRHVLDELAVDDDIHAVVVTGAGTAFCSGGDLSAVSSAAVRPARSTSRSMMHDIQPLLECIMRMDKPVIAAVNGPAIGFGMSLALACDLMVMAENAYLQSRFIKLGLVPDGGAAWFLARRLGYARMFEVVTGATRLTPEFCLSTGIANRVVEKTDVRSASLKWATELSANAPIGMALTKRLARLAMSNRLDESLLLEAEFQGICAGTEDAREAIAALQEKREPKFTGR
jgi:2-(1,2-epoxy-1,2-dihydrophenyl)acetyl-CoA isomerase